MSAFFQVIALSSLDPEGADTIDEPKLSYSEAIITAKELKSQGKAFRVVSEGQTDEQQLQSFAKLGAIVSR